MIKALPGCGKLEYNGFVFPATFQLKLNATAVYDEANLRLKYYSNVLNVTFIVTKEMVPGSLGSVTTGTDLGTVDNYVAAIRQVLQEPRRPLYINYQGLGFKSVQIKPVSFTKSGSAANNNVVYVEPNTVGDVAGGPLPRTFNIEPIGTSHAVRITWSIEFFTLRCLHFLENSILKKDGLIAIANDFQYGINESGVSSVTYSGYAEFAFAIRDGNEHRTVFLEQLKDRTSLGPAISNYQEKGFRCTKQEYTLSRDQRRIEFLIVLEEQPSGNALFPYSVKVEAKHRVKSSLHNKEKLAGSGFHTWLNDVSVTVTMAPGYPGSLAFAIFLWILNQRFGRIGTDRIVNPDNIAEQTGPSLDKLTKPNNVFLSLEIEENIYNRVHSFKAQYLGTYKLSRFFYQSGLFAPVYTVRDGTGKYPWEAGYTVDKNIHRQQWSLWTRTVGDRVQNIGGYRQESFAKTSILFDPCPANISSTYSYAGPDVAGAGLNAYNFVGEDKDNEDSYIVYEIDFQLIENTRNYQIGLQSFNLEDQQYLKTEPRELKVNRASNPEGDTFRLYGKDGDLSPETAYNSAAGGSNFILIMSGFAIRYKQKVPVPAVVGIKTGQSVVNLERIGSPKTFEKILSPGETSLHLAGWKIAYSVPHNLKGSIQAFDGNRNEINTGGRMIQTPGVSTT